MTRITIQKQLKSDEWNLVETQKPHLRRLLRHAFYEAAKLWSAGFKVGYVDKMRGNLYVLNETMSTYHAATRVNGRTFIIIAFQIQSVVHIISNGKVLIVKIL